MEIPLKNGLIDLDILMERLGEMNVSSILLEGGSRVIASALQTGIVDKVYAFYGPKILGGDDGIPVCRGVGPERMKESIGLSGISTRMSGNDVMIEAYVTSHTGEKR